MSADRSRRMLVVGVPLLIAALTITVIAPFAWIILLTDGIGPLALLAAAAGWGIWPVGWLRLQSPSFAQQLTLAIALGLGWFGLATLALGLAGALTAVTAWTLLGVGGLLGLIRLSQHTTRTPPPNSVSSASTQTPANAALRDVVPRALLTALLGVPLGLLLFGATLPPSVLWQAEGFGYDVLEYHLQVPREFFEAGQIHFLPWNVYAQFPAQVESLYLLLMHLLGGPYEAAIAAQLLHAALAIVAVVAVAVWARGPGGLLAAVVLGGVGWTVYVGVLAYVEAGILLFAAVAVGLIWDLMRFPASSAAWRWALAAGICAGLAGGCKYTAIVLVTALLGGAWLVTMSGDWRRRARLGALFALGGALAVSPWLARNAALAGNPVYPFAYGWFGGKAWSAEQAEQWDRGHHLPERDRSLAGRLAIAWRETGGAANFGPATFALLLVAVVLVAMQPKRFAALLLLWMLAVFVVWMGATHMPGRFLMPALVPLALLAAERYQAVRRRTERSTLAVLAGLVALLGSGAIGRDLWRHDRIWRQRLSQAPGAPTRGLSALVGASFAQQADDATQTRAAPEPDRYLWLVGNAAVFYDNVPLHYTVVFNRDPWLEFAANGASAAECVDWLRRRNVTLVVFSWDEIRRLAATYGFPAIVTPEWVDALVEAGLERADSGRGARGTAYYNVPREQPPVAGD